MSDQDKDQKTEDPTEKKLSEAREEGNFAKSPEMSVVFSLIAAFGVVSMVLPTIGRQVGEYTINVFSKLHQVDFDNGMLPAPVEAAGRVVVIAILPVLAATVVAGILSGGLQTGFRLSSKAVGFKLERLNPIAGFGRVFSQKTLVHGGIDFLKLIVIGGSLALAARTILGDPLFNAPVEAAYLGQFLRSSALALLSRLILALGCVAALSYAYERFKNYQDLKMSRTEVKDEQKQTEGDAHVKNAMRRMARRYAQKQMLAAVSTADVVITNPTHYAVALKYERGVDQAPVILAKGENGFARRIKALATEHSVPMVENRPVARMLFAAGKVGESIPAELYTAVAGILAFVYRTHRYYFHTLAARRISVAQN